MTDPQSSVPPAGWYTDPSGQPGERWWDGTKWIDATRPVPVQQPTIAPPEPSYGGQQAFGALQAYEQDPYAMQSSFGARVPQSPYGVQAPYGAQVPYGSQTPYGMQSYEDVRNIDPSTRPMWLIAFWPLLSVVVAIIYALLGGYDAGSLSGYSSAATLANGVNALLTIICYLLIPVLAYNDSKELKARQLPSPFGWGWGFLPLVYIIGRTVVVYQRTGRGLAPLFVYFGCQVASFVMGFIIGIVLAMAGVI